MANRRTQRALADSRHAQSGKQVPEMIVAPFCGYLCWYQVKSLVTRMSACFEVREFRCVSGDSRDSQAEIRKEGPKEGGP